MLSEFDAKAADWDKNQIHVERSEAIAEALLRMVPIDNRMIALEFGAGTGLLSFLLKRHFSEITLLDNSVEMISVIRKKITDQGISHMKPVLIDMEHEDFPGAFDIIYSQMVFHHVEKIDTILHKFNLMLNAGGYLVIADLYPEDGSFHGEGFTGHKGFDPEWLALHIKDAGFDLIQHQLCFTIKKLTTSGHQKEFPVFLIKAVKSE